MWDAIQTVIRILECLVKCIDKLYGEKEHYFIPPFCIFSPHVRLLLLSFSFIASWHILEFRHVSIWICVKALWYIDSQTQPVIYDHLHRSFWGIYFFFLSNSEMALAVESVGGWVWESRKKVLLSLYCSKSWSQNRFRFDFQILFSGRMPKNVSHNFRTILTLKFLNLKLESTKWLQSFLPHCLLIEYLFSCPSSPLK